MPARTSRAPVDRTSLSWQRTTAHSIIVSLVAAITSLQLGEPSVGIAAGALALVALGIGATTPRVHRSTAERREPWDLMARTVAVLGLSAVVALVLVVAVAIDA